MEQHGHGFQCRLDESSELEREPFPSGDETATFNNAGNTRTNISIIGLSGIAFITFDSGRGV